MKKILLSIFLFGAICFSSFSSSGEIVITGHVDLDLASDFNGTIYYNEYISPITIGNGVLMSNPNGPLDFNVVFKFSNCNYSSYVYNALSSSMRFGISTNIQKRKGIYSPSVEMNYISKSYIFNNSTYYYGNITIGQGYFGSDVIGFMFGLGSSNTTLDCVNNDCTFNFDYQITINSNYVVGSFGGCPTCQVCPEQYTSLECQTEYNLIPISSVDSGYCESNNLCQVCPDIPEFTGTLSNLYINDIFHLGAPVIQMNIPEEIDWDYAYTNSGYNMNIDIVGYNQDTEYINGLIDVQNYKPTSEDFTKVFMNFGNFGGLLIATLFIILVFYFVKKMFK